MKFLTFGQVIDNIRVGQVAVKVDGEYGTVKHDNTKEFVNSILYIDEHDYFLRGDNGRRVNGFYKSPEIGEDKFILIEREIYENMKDQLNNI